MTINLWESLANASWPRPNNLSALARLAQTARFGHGQQLSLEATDAGWVIKVFSRYGPCNSGIEILIPEDGQTPVKIIRDNFGQKSHPH